MGGLSNKLCTYFSHLEVLPAGWRTPCSSVPQPTGAQVSDFRSLVLMLISTTANDLFLTLPL